MVAQNRQTQLDLLKLCAFLSVVCLHVAATVWFLIPVDTWQWQVTNALRISWGVPVFVMATGSFLLNPTRHMSMKKLASYIIRVSVAFVFWSVVYVTTYILTDYWGNEISWKWVLIKAAGGLNHLWYLPMLAGLYLIVPFLRKICEDRKLTRYFLLLFFAAQSLLTYGVHLPKIGVVLQSYWDNMYFHIALGYSGYLVLGHYLSSKTFSRKKVRNLYLAGIICLIITHGADALYVLKTGHMATHFSEKLVPNVILMSSAVYVFFFRNGANWALCRRFPEIISYLSELGFGAYLVHLLLLWLFVHFLGTSFLEKNPLLWIPLLTLFISFTSFICSFFLKKIPVIGRYIA